MVHIEAEACKGCGICVYACPVGVLGISEKLNSKGVHYPEVAVNLSERCTSCKNCMIHCPDFAIVVARNE